MVSYAVKDWQGEDCGSIDLEMSVAREENAAHIVHRTLVRQQTNARQGNACTKTRAEVRGGGRKPWKQKGTGRARAGSSRSPLRPGGGTIFGPKPREFNVKVNRKERRLAIRTALMSRQEDTSIVDSFADKLQQPKTKELFSALTRWGFSSDMKVLMILDEVTEAIALSARNIPNLKILRANNLNVYDLLAADKIAISSVAVGKILEVYENAAH